MASAGVYIGVVGVFFFHALVVRFDMPDLRAFVLGKTENGVLCFHQNLLSDPENIHPIRPSIPNGILGMDGMDGMVLFVFNLIKSAA